MSRWFRMYDELLDDPKVQRLSGDDFKAWVNILCLASRKDGALPPVEDIGFALRIDARKASTMVKRLVDAGLLDQDGDRFTPHGWNARQYKSDVSTDRVKAFRKRKKGVAGNGDETFHETAPDTDTDTEFQLPNGNCAKSLFPEAPEQAKPIDADKQFWDTAKRYLTEAGVKNAGAVVGAWVRDHGKARTAEALTKAQLERAIEPIPFVQGCFRASKAIEQPVVPL